MYRRREVAVREGATICQLPRRVGRLLSIVLLCVGATFAVAATVRADGAPDTDTIELASSDVALTFARIRDGHARTVVLVTKYAGAMVEGVDLAVALDRHVNDPIITFFDQGYEGLRHLLDTAPAAARVRVPVDSLRRPIDLLDRHIAAGTNYPEHQGETDVTDGPFLFSKQVRATGPYAPVATHGGLLDYEVELAFVVLDALERSDAAPQWMGLLLCNDYTDRETLVRNINIDDVPSGDGFTTGKSFEGYLPLGSLFVIPRDYRAFAADLTLSLWVNGELRQHTPVSEHIWNIDRVFEQTWQRQAKRWQHRGGEVRLLDARDTINARTLLMMGTPGGTVFAGIDTGQRVRGAVSWLFGGWSRSLVDNVLDVYVDDAHSDRRYLQPGDTVTIRVDRMGVIENEITE
jgi:2-keto-4-pentenoate hydratase/2-oxohepta-3-ene-1,7-dioic acid hydratase in catechol pathway